MCTGTIIVVTGIQNRLGPAHRGNRIVHNSKVVAEVTVAMWNITTSTITISINNTIIRSIRMLLSINNSMLVVKRRGTIMVEVVAVVEAVVIISIINTPSMITTKSISSTNNTNSIINSSTSNMKSIIISSNNNPNPNKNNIRKVVVTGVALLERCRSYTSANRNPSSRKSSKSTCAANAGNPVTSTTWVGTRSRTSGAASSRP